MIKNLLTAMLATATFLFISGCGGSVQETDASLADTEADAMTGDDTGDETDMMDVHADQGHGDSAQNDAADGADAADNGNEVFMGPVQADCRLNSQPFPTRPEPIEKATLPLLHVEGRDIVDDEGNKVMLRGMNFGSWLMMESWLAGIGVLGQEELLGMMPDKAVEFGVAELFGEAQAINIIDCSFQLKAAWLCVQEWRQYMEENMKPGLEAGSGAFWAWFDSEPWIFEERALWNWLTKRFGYDGMNELRTTFQDNYITERDFELVAEMGMNLVRVPVWYQTLETDIDGENAFVLEGWRRLDQVIEWARKYRLYIMLDLHGAPGGQSPWWHQGLENGGQFFTRQDCIDKTARLWQAMARYFKGEPHVAVLDLLNEPAGAPDHERYLAAHQAIISAIRQENTEHIIMLEDGFLAMSTLAGPAEYGWENAMMSFHDYPGGKDAANHIRMMEEEITQLEKVWDRFDCPLFYGEFNVYGPNAFNSTDDPADRWQLDAMEGVLEMMNRRGVHWAPWSWKYFDAPSLWGVLYPTDGAGERLDVRDNDFDTINRAFEKLNTEFFTVDEDYAGVLERTAAAPYAPLDLAEAPK